jgi:3-hydroxy-9,10-secoandrosta-1,3,5(10)-triene-9,17-dione monooxygenase reductase component
VTPLDGIELRRIAGHYPTGVTVVTTMHEGRPCGLTVNSFTTVSLDPPLVLICVGHTARASVCVEASGRFAVNVLAEDQEAIARVFADKSIEDKFAGLRYRPSPTGQPLLEGIHAWLDCEVTARHEGGRTHTIYVALVRAAVVLEGRPLVFHHGAYERLGAATPR